MEATTAVALNIIAAMIFAFMLYVYQNRPLSKRMLLHIFLSHRKQVRVSVASLLKISNDGSFLLFRMRLRDEAFAPPGGVAKFYRSAGPVLDAFEFVPEIVPFEAHSSETMDLRGMLPLKNLLKFRRWLDKGIDRETYEECLRREIGEEIGELSLSGFTKVAGLAFQHVRHVEDGPKQVRGEHFLQFRIFEVMEIRSDTEANREFCDWVFNAALTSPDLLVCAHEDIARGRATSGKLVANHTQVLLSREILRPDQPLYRR